MAAICARLDGLPLAIELAAARIRLLTPQAILVRLEKRLDLLGSGARDLPDRQRTLRGAIAWSHDLLDAPERGLFACLAVFVGGASLDAIESVCTDSGGADTLESMASLAGKGLIRQADGVAGEARFEMLQTIRDFAAEQLAAATEGEATARARGQKHRDLYLALAEQAAENLMRPGRRLWLDRLEEEHDNLRAALALSIQRAEPDPALRLCVALWRFWQMRGYLGEGARYAEQALSLRGAANDPALHMRAIEAAAGLAYWMGDLLTARRRYQETLAISQQSGDRAGEANALYNMSLTYLFMSSRDLAKGGEAAQGALERFKGVGDRAGEARALWSLSNWAQATAQPDSLARTRDFGEQALRLFIELDDPFMTGWALYTLAQGEFLDGGDLDRVPALLGRALRIFAQAEDVSGYTLVVDGLAGHAMMVGDMRRSARLSGAVAALERQSGTGLNPVNREHMGFDPSSLRTDPLLAEEWEQGERMPLADVIAFAMAGLEGSPGSDDARRIVKAGQPRS